MIKLRYQFQWGQLSAAYVLQVSIDEVRFLVGNSPGSEEIPMSREQFERIKSHDGYQCERDPVQIFRVHFCGTFYIETFQSKTAENFHFQTLQK